MATLCIAVIYIRTNQNPKQRGGAMHRLSVLGFDLSYSLLSIRIDIKTQELVVGRGAPPH
jgi:hypothetical protein